MSHLKLYRYAAVAAALMFGASCGDSPTATPPPTVELERVGATASAQDGSITRGYLLKRNVTLSSDVSTSATITPDGGFLMFAEAGLLLYFPEGAVSETTVITATALKGNRVAYDFQPHGIVFNTPVYVAQELLQTELNTPRVRKKGAVWGAYLSHGAEDILADGSATVTEVFNVFYHGKGSETLAVFTTTHFSGYAFGSGRREQTQSEGF